MTTFHYDDTPLPVGVPMGMNDSKNSYLLGFYDGADYGDQYPNDPEESVLFESPEGAKRWLDSVTAVLTPYIEDGDREPRIPDPEGWADPDDG